MDLRDAEALCKAIRSRNTFKPDQQQENLISQVEDKVRKRINFFRSYESFKLQAIYRQAYS